MTGIGDRAFYGCSFPSSITIPNSVTSIGDYAFTYCELTSLTLPNSVTEIGVGAFYYCPFTSFTIPNNVKSISNNLFENCTQLTSVVIPNSVTDIGYGAFKNCIRLLSINIPNSVTSIGERAFDDCQSLLSVTIPNSVTSIGKEAFFYCILLTSVTLGNSVTSIGSGAFHCCPQLTNVYCHAEQVPNATVGPYSAFVYDGLANATLHVPAVSIDAYKAAETWKEFGSIVALTDEDPSPTGLTNVNQDSTTGRQYYSLDGKRSSAPQRGLNIIKMSDGTTRKVVIR